jgi:tRNA (guanine37-N1)-methyltransferase
MRFDVVTIFPEVFSALDAGLLGKALKEGLVEVAVHDLRRWAPEPHRKVDDEPFGGGPGMVLTPGPVVDAVEAVAGRDAQRIVLSAAGRRFDQTWASQLAGERQIVLVCGRYEGVDQRAVEILGAEELSIGDFVLTGGEVAAMAVIEATARLLPEFMGNRRSPVEESCSVYPGGSTGSTASTGGLLEHPHYTRPATFRGLGVPEVLLSGDHERISAWRREQSLKRTLERRPELVDVRRLTEEERALIDEWRSE